MLPAFLLGVLLLIGGLILMRWYVTTDPRVVLKTLFWTAGILLAGIVLFLLVTGRMNWAMAGIAVLFPWLMRASRGLALIRVLAGLLGGTAGSGKSGGRAGGAGAAPGQVSEVSSAYLHMKLFHDTGEMAGRVVAGSQAGRDLDDLSEGELGQLVAEVRGDGDSLALLESWLDRCRPDWREAMAGDADTGEGASSKQGSGGGSSGSAVMSRAEALEVLGLEEDADEAAVKAAYRRLMARFHPDHGGSDWMAAKLNQARSVLLKGR